MPDVKPKLLVISMMTALDNPTTSGFKFVLLQIKKEEKVIGYEYGFANWNGESWDEVDPSATVFKWGEMPNPQIIL